MWVPDAAQLSAGADGRFAPTAQRHNVGPAGPCARKGRQHGAPSGLAPKNPSIRCVPREGIDRTVAHVFDLVRESSTCVARLPQPRHRGWGAPREPCSALSRRWHRSSPRRGRASISEKASNSGAGRWWRRATLQGPFPGVEGGRVSVEDWRARADATARRARSEAWAPRRRSWLGHVGGTGELSTDSGEPQGSRIDGVVGSSSNFPLALPLMLISIASRHCSSGKVPAMGMLNFPAAAACAISPNVS